MSVISVDEINDGRGGGEELVESGAKSKDSRKFRVLTNSATDAADTVLASCIRLGTAHPTAYGLWATSRNATSHSKSKLAWVVTINYTSERYGSFGLTDNPLNQRAEITLQTESTREIANKDKDGEAILNSAGDYYEGGVPVEVSHLAFSIVKNIANTPSWLNDYRDAINNDIFYLDGVQVTVRTAKLSQIAIGKWAMQNKVWYRQLTMTIKIRDTWVANVLDRGLYRFVIDPDTGLNKRVKCIDNDGVEANTPQMLDGAGYQIPLPTPANVYFYDHYPYPEMPFSALPLF